MDCQALQATNYPPSIGIAPAFAAIGLGRRRPSARPLQLHVAWGGAGVRVLGVRRQHAEVEFAWSIVFLYGSSMLHSVGRSRQLPSIVIEKRYLRLPQPHIPP